MSGNRALRLLPISLLLIACRDVAAPTPQRSASAAALTQFPVTGFAVSAVSAGGGFSCGLGKFGQAFCWGANFLGELGNGGNASTNVPSAVAGGNTFAAVVAGNLGSCGVTTKGQALCWGQIAYLYGNVPAPVPSTDFFVTVSTFGFHACALTKSGKARCWGDNTWGQLGDGTTTSSGNVPVPVAGDYTFATLSAGYGHTCGVTKGGQVLCWGYNFAGALGDGTNTNSSTPVPLSSGYTFSSVSAGAFHTCAVTKEEQALCWGRNPNGQLGNGTTTDSNVPVPVAGGYTFAGVTTGAHHSCGVTKSGQGLCWGDNAVGELGDGTLNSSAVPVQVGSGFTFVSISASISDHTCGLTKDLGAWCWGWGQLGQLGNGTNISSTAPTPVASP